MEHTTLCHCAHFTLLKPIDLSKSHYKMYVTYVWVKIILTEVMKKPMV